MIQHERRRRPHLAPLEAATVVGGKRCRIGGEWSAWVRWHAIQGRFIKGVRAVLRGHRFWRMSAPKLEILACEPTELELLYLRDEVVRRQDRATKAHQLLRS